MYFKITSSFWKQVSKQWLYLENLVLYFLFPMVLFRVSWSSIAISQMDNVKIWKKMRERERIVLHIRIFFLITSFKGEINWNVEIWIVAEKFRNIMDQTTLLQLNLSYASFC